MMKAFDKLSAAALALAFVARAHASFQAKQANVVEKPSLKLPWGTYEGEIFSKDKNIYLFQNVRYGVIPQRFSAPSFPDVKNSSVQPPSDGRNCIAIQDEQTTTPSSISYEAEAEMSEDCLFLDVYVPTSVFAKSDSKLLLPVVTWFHGGGFVAGNKNSPNGTYTGQPMLRESNYSVIYVAANYRLGAYGWLAGNYMEKSGQPNAGLHDQALVFEWVREYIHQVHGDKSQVTAMGESAGASSLVHHLIREDGQRDPLFTRFAVQSPLFKWSWDNSPNGTLDQLYQKVSEKTKCGPVFNIECLRNSPDLAAANQAVWDDSRIFPFGPAVDGKWVTTIPSVAFAQGRYWKNVNSTIISHTGNEIPSLVTANVSDAQALLRLLQSFLPDDKYPSELNDILQRYDCEKNYPDDYPACAAAIIGDFGVYCNARVLLKAYPAQSRLTRYEFPNKSLAPHSNDLFAFFANTVPETAQWFENEVEAFIKDPNIAKIISYILAGLLIDTNTSAAYQRYFASFVLTGNPNTLHPPPIPFGPAPNWPVANNTGSVPSNVLKVQAPIGKPAFTLGTDEQLNKTTCDFWQGLAERIVATS